MFDKLEDITGAIDEGQELWGVVRGALSSLMDEGLPMDKLSELGETLKSTASHAMGLVDKLPEGELKEQIEEELNLLLELGPKVEGAVEPLQDIVQGSSDLDVTEWAAALHEQLVGEYADSSLVDEVEELIGLF